MNELTLSVDPGLHGLGCGLWAGKELVAGWYAGPAAGGRGPARWRQVVEAGLAPLAGVEVGRLVVEVMQIYPHMKGDPDDVLEVQGVAGALAGWRAWKVEGVTARAWKGQVPQAIMAERIEGRLTARGWVERLDPACPARRRHDMLHGVGVGMFVLDV